MNAPSSTSGSQMLAILRGYGVDAVFGSPGSEWPPLWDALIEAQETGAGPAYYNARHEELAVCMAMGYYRQTGRLPVVPLHTTVGLLKASMAIRAALHERIPMVVLPGESNAFGEGTGFDPSAAWWQAMLADLGGPAALGVPYTKRSQQVMVPELLPGMLQDSCRAALSEPRGPVVLSVPMEVLLPPARPLTGPEAPPIWRTSPNAGELDGVADLLVQAERPLILTEAAGARPENVARLVELAELLAIPVVEAGVPAYMNFPRAHPLHQGFSPSPLPDEADVVLLVASAAPWYPPSRRPAAIRHLVLLDDYPTYDRLPYWGFGVDRCVGGDLGESLVGLSQRLAERLAARPDLAEVVQARRARLAESHRQQQAARQAPLAEAADAFPIDTRWLGDRLNAVLPSNAIVVEELIVDRPNVLQYSNRTEPGTWHSTVSGGLGVGIGTALGVKVGAPDRIVVEVTGDGAFHYNPVVAALGFAQEYALPIMLVICNNGAYVSMRESHLRFYPQGWAARTGRFVGPPIQPSPDYAGLARNYGGWGRRVERPADLQPALEEGLEHLSQGQVVIIDVPTIPARRTSR